jgi:uncharacterized protein (TIRG00374 family)
LLRGNLTGIIRENKLFWTGQQALFKSKKGKYISYGLRFAVAGGALYLAFRGEDLSKIGKLLLGLNPPIVLIAVATWLANQVLFVTRWQMLLRVQSIKVGYWAAFRLHFLGIFYNNCLPSAVGGDLLRAWYVTTHTDRKLEAALSVFVDRFIGISGMVIMAVVCYRLIPTGAEDVGEVSYKVGIFDTALKYWPIAVGIVAALLVVLLLFSLFKKGRELLGRIFGFAYKRGRALLAKVRTSITIYYRNKLTLVFALILTFACQGIFIVGLMLIGRDIGLTVHWKYYFVFFPVAWMLGALPISVGGLGIWEGALIIMFGGTGVIRSEHIAALALFHRALWLFGSLPGVFIHLCGAHLPKDFSVDYNGGSS